MSYKHHIIDRDRDGPHVDYPEAISTPYDHYAMTGKWVRSEDHTLPPSLPIRDTDYDELYSDLEQRLYNLEKKLTGIMAYLTKKQPSPQPKPNYVKEAQKRDTIPDETKGGIEIA